jgi:hypothetical protein
MVNEIQVEYGYTLATESEVNDLLEGKEVGASYAWSPYSKPPQLPIGATGVLWKKGNNPYDPVQPLALVAREEEFRRLCGRFAQLRSDLSPLTAWCHLLSPKLFDLLGSSKHDAQLGGFEAAWTGLIVAEAHLISQRPLDELRVPACLGTQTFGIARARALWKDVSNADIVRRFEEANTLVKGGKANRVEPRTGRVRHALEPIWTCLSAASLGEGPMVESDLLPILASLEALREARQRKDKDEAAIFVRPLLHVIPEAEHFFRLQDIAPEQRLRIFDQLVSSLSKSSESRPSIRKNALAMLAGYLITVAAGGTPTLTLAESNAQRLPEITGWAYVIGGIGERVIWTSSFNGIGRFVARELMRPLRLDESPTCDFALDEASVLVDPKLIDPLVHLRIKYGTLATIALLPGVNISISIIDSAAQEIRPQPIQPARQSDSMRPGRNPVALIADAIWPYLRPHVEDLVNSMHERDVYSPNYGPSNKRRSTSQLPLKESKK